MYATEDFPTKSALRKAVEKHIKEGGPAVTIYAPGYGEPKENGVEYLEGPHAPKPHKWYARVMMHEGAVVEVLD